jgi:hypothetical protein
MKSILPLLVLSTQLMAADPFISQKDGELKCFGREYSEAHMDKHPKQNVKQIKLKLEKKDPESNLHGVLSVEATLRGKENTFKTYRAEFICLSEEKDRCLIECDGGSVELKKEGDRLTLKNKGFVLQGGCGDEEENFKWLNDEAKGDDIFYTYELRSEFCQK